MVNSYIHLSKNFLALIDLPVSKETLFTGDDDDGRLRHTINSAQVKN